MKIIKINPYHYVLADGSLVEDQWNVCFAKGIKGEGGGWFLFFHKGDTISKLNAICADAYKVIKSTQPLDVKITDEGIHLPDWSKVKPLSPRIVKELIGEVDVEKMAEWEVECVDSKLKLKEESK